MSRSRDADQSLPAELAGAAIDPASNEEATEPVAGVIVGDEKARAGEDTRRRGWFWHWNAIVTQYAPLVGLKGVGLINSYTVWTDRREESPHRGFAFPSQQSEADFYGEDRSELITINKILVSLDLIEIRKEMVLRVDEAGRRWRVPHNLYRVKDRDDGFSLTADAVDRVVQLAARDRSVYRYIRHIFSPKFRPIDANNVWAGILESVRTTHTWSQLADRAAQEDARASARTKAGHRSRKGGSSELPAIDQQSGPPASNDSLAGESTGDAQTIVALSNKGLVDVAPTNNGLDVHSESNVADANEARPSDVAPANTTYNQQKTTTTTSKKESRELFNPAADLGPAVTDKQISFGPGGSEAPFDRAGHDAALRAFHDANHRDATIAERKLLRDLAERFEMAARESDVPGRQSGWQWVAAAIFDAVDAGSTYVAPRRVREILARWEREGLPGADSKSMVKPESQKKRRNATEPALGRNAGIDLPHGRDSGSTWELAVRFLSVSIDTDKLAELVEGTFISGYRDGEVTIQASNPLQASRLAGEYHALAARKLGEAMRRPVKLSIAGDDGAPFSAASDPPESEPAVNEHVQVRPFALPEIGLSSTQVWQAVTEDLQRKGRVGRANIEAWLRPSVLIGREDRNTFIVGTPNALARKRVAERFAPAIADSLSDLLGISCEVAVVIAQDWMRGQTRAGSSRTGELIEEPTSEASA